MNIYIYIYVGTLMCNSACVREVLGKLCMKVKAEDKAG